MRFGTIKQKWMTILNSLKTNDELTLGAVYDYMPTDSSPMPNASIIVQVLSEEPTEDGTTAYTVRFDYFHRAVAEETRLDELYTFIDDFRDYIMEFRGLPDVTTLVLPTGDSVTAPNGGQIMWEVTEIRRDVYNLVDVETDKWIQGAIITVTHYTREAENLL